MNEAHLSPPAAVRWLISGCVQGVGFRYHVLREARRLGVRGDVRNLADGRVEVRAQAPAVLLERLLDAVRRGPRHARVERVDSQALDEGAIFEGFEVRF